MTPLMMKNANLLQSPIKFDVGPYNLLHDVKLYRGMAKVGNGCMMFIAILEVCKGK
jgi:hypothetical protein